MQHARTKAIHALRSSRCFSTAVPRSAASPYRSAQVASTKLGEAKRPQSTQAQATQAEGRPRPAPAFNREDYDVQPLRRQQPEMDHSLVGLKGGEIFHEMMLRHDVKHICAFFCPLSLLRIAAHVIWMCAIESQANMRLGSWIPWRRHPPRLRRNLPLQALRLCASQT